MLASAAKRWLRPGSFRLFSPKAMRLMSRLRGRVGAGCSCACPPKRATRYSAEASLRVDNRYCCKQSGRFVMEIPEDSAQQRASPGQASEVSKCYCAEHGLQVGVLVDGAHATGVCAVAALAIVCYFADSSDDTKHTRIALAQHRDHHRGTRSQTCYGLSASCRNCNSSTVGYRSFLGRLRASLGVQNINALRQS